MLGNAEAMRLVAEKSGIALDTVPLESMKMAMTVVATGPIVLLYPFVQRYFVKGLTICVIPFIIADIIKLSLATIVGKSILRRVNLGYSIKTS